jgi:hypothetical protein
MLLEHPDAKLAPHFWLADAFDDLHRGIAEDEHPRAVYTRVRVTHPDHDAGDTPRSNGSRAGGCTAVEGTGLESGVERRANDTVPLRVGVKRGRDFGVILTRAKRMPTPEELTAGTHDRATDPWVVPRNSAGTLRLFDCETHPPLVVEAHRIWSITHLCA